MKNRVTILALVFAICTFFSFGQTTFNSSGTYTTGPTETCIRVQVWAAGGGGAGNASSSDGGGGGGGGGYSESYLVVTPNTNYTVTVGAGGAGGFANNNGANGGDSWFGTPVTVFAYGGVGGISPLNNGFSGGVGGTGGVAGIGQFIYAGGNGGNGSNDSRGRGGGGGSSAGTAANGGSGGNGTGGFFGFPGFGGNAPAGGGGGDGGNGGNQNQNGNAGTTPGGGGGGSGEAGNGGAGANGRIIVTPGGNVCPTATTIAPGASQSLCAGLPTDVLTATTTFTGTGCGQGSVQYQWYSSILNTNSMLFATPIAGQTAQTFTPPNGNVGTFYYFCVSYSSGCGQTSTTQSLASNVVQVTILIPPTTPNAGADQAICVGNNTTMSANNPILGSAQWSIISGPSLLTSQLSSTTDPNATFNPVGGIGNYVLRWSITAACGTLTDDVVITVYCGGSCPPCVYAHPAGNGIAGEKVGACEVADCGPSIYTDDGGGLGNYSDNIGNGQPQNAVYRTFCPSLAGNCTTVTFNSFVTANNYDVLYVRNGPTEFSPNFTGAPNTNSVYTGNTAWNSGLWGDLSGSVPFSFTSTHPSGCLTFAFVTSSVNNAAGWTATLTCTPCAGGPNGTDNNDCINATPLCSNAAVGANSTGPGIVAEGCNGSACPAGGENHTNWYRFTAATSGSLSITVSPTSPSDDYDIAVFGPNVSCNSLGAPIRCTDAALSGTTGAVGYPTPDPNSTTENVSGDKFVDELTVNAGETYYLMVDEWTPTGAGYNLTFGGTASLDCVVLPIELVDFTATYNTEFEGADLYWKTASELNNDYFTIERSKNAFDFKEVTTVKGAGTTTYATEYIAFDPDVEPGVTYYRLKQTDYDGNAKYSEVRAVNVLKDGFDVLTFFPNPTSGKTEVIFNSYEAGLSELVVMDYRGVVVSNEMIETSKGGNRVELDLQDLAQGVYFISVVTRNMKYTGKVVRQ